MKEKLWPSVIVAAAIIFSAVLVCVFAGRPMAADATPHSPVAARDTYKIGKVEAIMDKVIAREAIEDAYFYFLDGDAELIAALEEHNEQAARWRLNFTRTAIDTMAGVLMMERGTMESR